MSRLSVLEETNSSHANFLPNLNYSATRGANKIHL